MDNGVPKRNGNAGSDRFGPGNGKRNGRRPFLALIGVVAVLALGFGAYAFATRNQESTDDAQVEGDVVALAARVAGPVLRVPVSDNQAVKKGDLLIEIDPTDYLVRLKQSEAELDAARAQWQSAQAQERIVEANSTGGLSAAKAQVSGSAVSARGADAQVNAARAALAKAEAEAERAATNFKRFAGLLPDGAVSQSEYDNARAAHDSAQAAVAQAQAQLAAAEDQKQASESRVTEAQGRLTQSAPVSSQLAVARAAVALAEAKVKQQEAALEQARLQVSYTRIVAPADGVLSRMAVREGQYVQATQMVAELVPATTYVVANFKETQVGRMRPGQRATITVDAYPGRRFGGRIESVAGATGARFSLLPPDNASGNFVKDVQRVPVKIAWAAPPAAATLQAGLSAEVTVTTK